MLLVALYTWRERLVDPTRRLCIRGDAKGTLQNVVAGSAPNPELNLMVGEIQLILADTADDVTAIHWWSVDSSVRDALSRQTVAETDNMSMMTPASRKAQWELVRQSIRSQICPRHQSAE